MDKLRYRVTLRGKHSLTPWGLSLVCVNAGGLKVGKVIFKGTGMVSLNT